MRLWTHRLPGILALGLVAGSILEKCVSHSLQKRGCQKPGRLFWLPAVNALIYTVYTGAAAGKEGQAGGIFSCLCASALLAVGIIDQKTLEIPRGYNLFIGAVGLLQALCRPGRWYEYAAGFLAVSSLLYLVFLFTGGKGVGGGDVKLMAAAGLFLGWGKILWAFWTGAAAGVLVQSLPGKEKGRDKRFALGPFLAAGILAQML